MSPSRYIVILLMPFLFVSYTPSLVAGQGGRWQLLQKSIGVSAMHMQLLHNDHVVILDRNEFGPSNLSLADGRCREDEMDDCTAHSAEYNVLDNSFRPLTVFTNTWCSSGSTFPNGELVQTGGFNDGEKMVRIFKPCDDGTACDWDEIGSKLLRRRWYATNHILPDGKMIIVGGTRQFSYEFYPKSDGFTDKLYDLPFLAETTDPGVENNLYPFVFLNTDGNLFIFGNNRAILYDYSKGTVVKSYPTIPGGDPRNYPSTGSAVLLPLKNINGTIEAEVLVCGGAPKGSFEKAQKGEFIGALDTCARIKINDPKPEWVMETMPMARLMGDMLLLPDGNVLIINGAGSGIAGWELGRDPVLKPVIYKPNAPLGSRFDVQNPTTVPRMYHSTAILVRDGSVLVGGSNAHRSDVFTNVLFPTEYSLEAFYPSYLDQRVSRLRPRVLSPLSNKMKINYSRSFIVRCSIKGKVDRSDIKVTIIRPSFNTHSFSHSQRLVELSTEGTNVVRMPASMYRIQVDAPTSAKVAPPGYYMLFVVYKGIPSEGTWVQVE